jgi:glutathione synthase/RimK-type ligase-like ATP-grasp enzyme
MRFMPWRTLPVGGYIAKPVAGGDYCYPLEDTLQAFPDEVPRGPMPAIVQQRLVSPEIRIYVIGERAFAYAVQSPSLDYRLKQDAVLAPVPPPAEETAALQRLMAEVQMDFGAADFKTDPDSGKLIFLELNTSPMFARFDATSDGALCRAMVEVLCKFD